MNVLILICITKGFGSNKWEKKDIFIFQEQKELEQHSEDFVHNEDKEDMIKAIYTEKKGITESWKHVNTTIYK